MNTNRYFEIIDKEGKGRNDVPEFEDALKEIVRSHEKMGRSADDDLLGFLLLRSIGGDPRRDTEPLNDVAK